jgi:hypothetical protein
LSFFDEVDEPAPAPRPRRPAGSGGRRPPTDQQQIAARRAVAGVVILVVVILLVVLVHGCQVSARNSSLRNYTNNVSALIQSSDGTAQQLFGLLAGGGSATDATSLTTQIDQARQAADQTLSKAKGLDVPSEVSAAQQHLILALTMRRDGIAGIAKKIGAALASSTSGAAVGKIASAMALFYASDAIYKSYTTPEIAQALHGAGIAVGGPNGETIDSGQFLPDLSWLTPAFIAGKLGVSSPTTTTGPVAPGTHGHSLDAVSVGGTTLQTGSSNQIPRSPPPTFKLNFTNSGQNNETNVVLKVTITGAGISGQTVVPTTTAGQSGTANVTLKTSPPAGSYTLVATVQKVGGEKNLTNNTLSFPVSFQ